MFPVFPNNLFDSSEVRSDLETRGDLLSLRLLKKKTHVNTDVKYLLRKKKKN